MSERHHVVLIDGSLRMVCRNKFPTLIAIRRNHATYRRSVVRGRRWFAPSATAAGAATVRIGTLSVRIAIPPSTSATVGARIAASVWASNQAASPRPDVAAKLLVVSGPLRKSQFPLGTDLVIGRDLDSTIRLDDPAVSPRHCSIASQDGQLILCDLDSHAALSLMEFP